jgi:dienelactone hydrolase
MISRRDLLRGIGKAGIAAAIPPCLIRSDRPQYPPAPDFTAQSFTDSQGITHSVFSSGAGPPVLLLHELPGLSSETFRTARRLRDARYTVLMPLFFGAPGDSSAFGNMHRVCGNDQFACRRGDRTSPHVTWLRELARCASESSGHKAIGVIGMCLTGAFPLPMLREPVVKAPVLCQPTLPFNRFNPLHAFGWFTDQDALAVHPDDLAFAKSDTTVPLLGIRYRGDRRCKKERFARLRREFPDRFYRLDLEGKHHSTLVGDFSPDALNEVLAFFNQQLRTTPDPAVPAFPILAAPSDAEVIPPRSVEEKRHAH